MKRFALFLLWACGLAGQDFYLKPGDRVVFYGDSITDQRLYTTFAETFVVTRFPRLDVRFTHSGWGGDRVTGGGGGPVSQRLRRDMAVYKPTVMTVMLGMNDGRYRAWDDEVFQAYASGYRELVAMAKGLAPGVRMMLIRPSPYDEVAQPPAVTGYNAVLVKYGDFLSELAKEHGFETADLNANVVAMLKKAQAANPQLAARIIPDRVHPGAAGHLIMAGELIRAWRAPAVVTSVRLDARDGKVVETQRTAVTGLRKSEGAWQWTQLDEALPMPVSLEDAVIRLAVESSDFVASFNQQPLRVDGLPEGRYELKIDGQAAGAFSAGELAAGVNLALLPTPMQKQAAEVHRLTLRRTEVHNVRWRTLEVPLANDYFTTAPAALRALDELDEEIRGRQRLAAQPVARRYELTPAR
jgi:lysophospholipase L1-like esterase